MERKRFNMKLLFGEEETSIDIANNKIFHKAALLYNFDMKEHFGDLSKEESDLLREHSFERATDGMRRLSKEDRLDILENGIGIENLESAIEEYHIESIFTNLIKRIVQNEYIKVDELSNVELYYAIVLNKLFPSKFDKEEFKNSYTSRQFFKPFRNITKHFAGRKKELAEIRDYVDWHPKSNWLGKVGAGLRSMIDFHEKPPMLIQGIGGIGKSALVSQFILEHNNIKNGRQLPFVYLDFDIPGFSIKEPMTILIEALRQIAIQFPRHEKLISSISKKVSDMIKDTMREVGIFNKSTSSSRGFIFDDIENIVQSASLDLDQISETPILIVFDSFEEMQYRATDDELRGFMLFIEEVSRRIPRIRPIFVGRAEIRENFLQFKFQKITIKDFDRDSADALLINWGVDDRNVRSFIYDNFGGNPLMLRLSTDLALKGDFDGHDSSKIQGKKWEYLVDRILGHIHNKKVRKIAVPGMLVRTVTPDVIKKVLTEPTGLIYLDDEEVNKVFKELKREVALISKSFDRNTISFRQDLRMVCEETIWQKYPDQSRQVRDKSIAYYRDYKNRNTKKEKDLAQAEYFFHMLKDEQIPEELDSKTYRRLSSYLEQSIIELPASSQHYVRSLNRQGINQASVKEATPQEWEFNNGQLIKSALNGELSSLRQIYAYLRRRRSRLKDGFTEFGKWEALLLQRLNKLDDSTKLINKALERGRNLEKDEKLAFDLILIKIQNLEYQKQYSKALKVALGIADSLPDMDSETRKRFEFLHFRIRNRPNKYHETPFFLPVAGTTYSQSDTPEFIETPWQYIFAQMEPENVRFMKDETLLRTIRKMRRKYSNLKELEQFSFRTLNAFLKDITYPGEHAIVVHDLVFALEVKGVDYEI